MKGREAMRRLFAFLIAAVLLLGIVGCKSSTPQFLDPDFKQLPMIPGKAYTDYSGIEIRIDSLNWQQEDGNTTLTGVPSEPPAPSRGSGRWIPGPPARRDGPGAVPGSCRGRWRAFRRA